MARHNNNETEAGVDNSTSKKKRNYIMLLIWLSPTTKVPVLISAPWADLLFFHVPFRIARHLISVEACARCFE